MPFNVALVLFPDFEELDYAGPYEVFGMTAKYIDKEWRVFTVAASADPVRANIGMRVLPDYAFEDAPPADVIVVPGGIGTRAGASDEQLVGYIRRAGQPAQWVTSVCTGAMLLHAAGFLEGKRATTHWGAKKELQELGGDVTLVDERWVHDGNVITSAGVSAGIDMALYLVGILKGPEVARNVQRFMEYEPAPPYAEVPARL